MRKSKKMFLSVLSAFLLSGTFGVAANAISNLAETQAPQPRFQMIMQTTRATTPRHYTTFNFLGHSLANGAVIDVSGSYWANIGGVTHNHIRNVTSNPVFARGHWVNATHIQTAPGHGGW